MFYKYIMYSMQDILLKKKVFFMVIFFIIIMMTLAIIPNHTMVLTKWHSVKDFMLLFRYEYFHLPILLVLLGSFSEINEWILLRRYTQRQQIAWQKVCLVFIVTAILTVIITLGSIICTALVKWLIFPSTINYSSLFLYTPERIREDSSLYFIYMYFCVTAICGLVFIVLQQLVKNNFLSMIIVLSVAILDQMTISIIPIFFYSSEFTSPISSLLILLAIAVLFINTIHYLVNKLDFYVRDDKE